VEQWAIIDADGGVNGGGYSLRYTAGVSAGVMMICDLGPYFRST